MTTVHTAYKVRHTGWELAKRSGFDHSHFLESASTGRNVIHNTGRVGQKIDFKIFGGKFHVSRTSGSAISSNAEMSGELSEKCPEKKFDDQRIHSM